MMIHHKNLQILQCNVSQTKKDEKLKSSGSFNSFLATSLFLYTLKTFKNLLFSDIFIGYRKWPVGWNGSK